MKFSKSLADALEDLTNDETALSYRNPSKVKFITNLETIKSRSQFGVTPKISYSQLSSTHMGRPSMILSPSI